MALFQDLAQKLKDVGGLIKAELRASQARTQAKAIADKLEASRQAPPSPVKTIPVATPEVTAPAMTPTSFSKYVPQFLKLKSEEEGGPVGIYRPGSEPARVLEEARALGKEVEEKIGKPLATGFERAQRATYKALFEYPSRVTGGTLAGTPARQPGESATQVIERQPFLSQAVTEKVRESPLGIIPGVAPVIGFLSEALLPPYGGLLGKARFTRDLSKTTDKAVVKETLKKGVKDITEEDADALATKIAPIKDPKAVEKELDNFAKAKKERGLTLISKDIEKKKEDLKLVNIKQAEQKFDRTGTADVVVGKEYGIAIKDEGDFVSVRLGPKKLTPIEEGKVFEKNFATKEDAFDFIKDVQKRLGVPKKLTEVKPIPKSLEPLAQEARIELPVRRAVKATFDEGSKSSGFHEKFSKDFNGIEPSWAIVYDGKISDAVRNAALKAGLKINEREIFKGAGKIHGDNGFVTDVYLPGVKQAETPKATQVFNKFADFYNQATKGVSNIGRTGEVRAIAPGEVVPRPGQPKPREEKFPIKEGSQPLAKSSSDAYEKVYHADADAVKESIEIEMKLSPTDAGPSATPEKIDLFNKFKDKASNAWLLTREFVEDDWLRVKKLMAREDVKVTEASDPYTAETLMHGRAQTRVEEARKIVDDIDKDIIKTAKESGVKDPDLVKDVNLYLHARHAPERNDAIGMGAAGMFSSDARAIVKNIEALPHGKEVVRIADRLQDFNNKTLDVLLEGEVIDQKLFDTLRNRYKNHVPLNRVMENTEDIGSAISGRPFDVKSTGIRRATGSLKRPVADIQTNIVTNYEQAIIRAEKNRVDLATLRFARDNPHLGIFEEIRPKAIGKTFGGDIIRQHINNPQTLVLREKGLPVFLRINDPNLAVALRGINRYKVDGIMRAIGAFTRFYSSVATRFNPEFAFPNKIRDLQEATVYMMSKGEIGYRGAVKAPFKDPRSFKGVTDFIRGKNTPDAQLYRQMRLDGGTTGGLGLSTRARVELDLEKIRRANRSNKAKAADMIARTVEHWNTVWEDSTRLTIYRTALDRGVSRQTAARLAKEGTINFNKFGRGGPVLNALYMFSNASIQGSAKMLRAMKNPKVAGTVIAAVGASVAAVNEWNDAIDPDWREKVTKWDRMNSLTVVLPNEGGGVRYIAIPVSWGLKPIKVAMDYMWDAGQGKVESVGDAMSGTLAAILEGYNPAGGTDLLQAVTPTILDMPVDVARNRTWFGGKLRPDWDESAPGSIQYFSSLKDTTTGKTMIGVSKGMSGLGIEISPADMNYAYENLIGGAGRTASKFFNTMSAIAGGELPKAREVPFASRFYRTRDEESVGAGSTDFEDVKKILGEQSRQRFYQKQEAEDSYNQLKALPKEEAVQRFNEIEAQDPTLADKLREIADEDKKGLTYTDRLIKQLGVTNGERSRYLKKKFDQLKNTEEKVALWNEYTEKGIITEKVGDQIRYLIETPSYK